jgi:hypothetical protein
MKKFEEQFEEVKKKHAPPLCKKCGKTTDESPVLGMDFPEVVTTCHIQTFSGANWLDLSLATTMKMLDEIVDELHKMGNKAA